MSEKFHTILVLTDGETWNTLDGCEIIVINDAEFKDLCDGHITVGDVHPVSAHSFKGWSC